MIPILKNSPIISGLSIQRAILFACLSFFTLNATFANEDNSDNQEADEDITSENNDNGLIVFLDGSHLSGRLSHIVDRNTIAWLLNQSDNQILFPISSIHRMVPGGPRKPHAINSEASILLTNNDTLLGNLRKINDTSVTIKNAIYGELTIPRNHIREIHIMQGGFYLLPEIGQTSDWTQSNKDGWLVHENALVNRNPGTIMRQLPEADRIHISFDLHHQSLNPQLKIYLFAANKANPGAGTNYEIHVNNVFAYARKNIIIQGRAGLFGPNRKASTESLGEPVRIPQQADSNKLRFDIKADLRRNIIELHINDELVTTWNDPRGLDNPGNSFGFESQNQEQGSIRNLRVTRWHGGLNQNLPDNLPDKLDVVDLQNGDVFTGTITSADDQTLTIITDDFGEFSLPTSRLIRMNLAQGGSAQSVARLMNGDIQISLLEGGTFVFQLLSIENDFIQGYSENFGHISLQLNAVTNIEFNLYDTKQEKLDAPPPADPASLLDPPW